MKLSPKEVGQKIRLIRKEKGLTMEEFGTLIGDVKKSAVGNWERGDNFPNNERLKRIAEIGDTSVEYLLTGNELRDRKGNLMDEGLRLFDYKFLGHYGKKLKDSPVRVIYSFIKLSKDDSYYYCGIRSSVVLGTIDISTRNATITILSESLEKNEFYNSAPYSRIDFNSDENGITPFIECDYYLSSMNLVNKDFKNEFLTDLLDKLLNIVKKDKEIAFDDISFKGKLHYFKLETTKTINLNIDR